MFLSFPRLDRPRLEEKESTPPSTRAEQHREYRYPPQPQFRRSCQAPLLGTSTHRTRPAVQLLYAGGYMYIHMQLFLFGKRFGPQSLQLSPRRPGPGQAIASVFHLLHSQLLASVGFYAASAKQRLASRPLRVGSAAPAQCSVRAPRLAAFGPAVQLHSQDTCMYIPT